MWSLRQRENDEFYLTYDKDRWRTRDLRGLWELIGATENEYTKYCVRVNTEAGLLCAPDDQGNTRVLVLTE
jgi:hypothetical protein